MIKAFNNDSLPPLPTSWQSTYITSRFLSYGGNAPFAPFYTDENGTILSVLNTHAAMCTTTLDVQEWAIFLAMHPDILTVTAPLAVAEKLAQTLGSTVSEKKILRLNAPLQPPQITITEPSPRLVYPLLSAVFGDTMPPFEDWYVDVSHRVRHGYCTVAAVERNGAVASSAMTVAEAPDAVVIGAVATAENARKQGFAAECIRYLAQKHADKTVLISPKNAYAERLYTTLGFTNYDTLGQFSTERSV